METMLNLADWIAAFKVAYAKWPASWPHLVKEGGRDVLYATWLIGNDYRNQSKYYGAFPPGFTARVMALFSNVQAGDVLHAFSGSLQPGGYVRLDINPTLGADVVGSVYDAAKVLKGRRFELVIADPPYSAEDALKYRTRPIDRRRALAALAEVTRPKRHLVWVDTVWPMHRKAEWLTVGRIAIVRSTNHRIRMATIFERQAA